MLQYSRRAGSSPSVKQPTGLNVCAMKQPTSPGNFAIQQPTTPSDSTMKHPTSPGDCAIKQLTSPDDCAFCNRLRCCVLCLRCGYTLTGRVQQSCPLHKNVIHVMDMSCCPRCFSKDIRELPGQKWKRCASTPYMLKLASQRGWRLGRLSTYWVRRTTMLQVWVCLSTTVRYFAFALIHALESSNCYLNLLSHKER